MLRWLGQCYARRIVNVNVNIVVAGVLALPPTLLAVWVAHRLGVPQGWRISLITFVTDITADVMVYFVLHWLANHWPALHVLRREEPDEPPKERLSFFKDATLVQVERAALSPLLYLLLLGTQYLLTHRGMHPVPATAIAFGLAIGTTRALHTFWMYKQERKARLVFKRLARKAKAEQRLKTGPAPAISVIERGGNGHVDVDQPAADDAGGTGVGERP
jgi:hypothetical protein